MDKNYNFYLFYILKNIILKIDNNFKIIKK